MFCGKCGAENDGGSVFCCECGEPLNDGQKKPGNAVADVKLVNKNRKIGIITSAVIVAVLLIVIFNLFGGRGYKTTVKKFFEASIKADAKTMIKLIPEGMLEGAQEEEGWDREELKKKLKEELEEEKDSLESTLGDKWKMTYKIHKSKDVSGKDLKELKKDYGEYDVKVTAAKNVEVEVTVKGKDIKNSTTIEIPVIKVGRNWYLDLDNMGKIF